MVSTGAERETSVLLLKVLFQLCFTLKNGFEQSLYGYFGSKETYAIFTQKRRWDLEVVSCDVAELVQGCCFQEIIYMKNVWICQFFDFAISQKVLITVLRGIIT